MTVEKFKEAIVNPLKKTIEQNKTFTLAQFRSRDDVTKHWDRAEGMEMCLNHIESVYASMNPEGNNNIEIIPPQK